MPINIYDGQRNRDLVFSFDRFYTNRNKKGNLDLSLWFGKNGCNHMELTDKEANMLIKALQEGLIK